MKYLKLFENIRSKKETAELLEDLFVEIFDKWEIKELPNDIDDEAEFFANIDTEDLYYSIIPFLTNSTQDRLYYPPIVLMIKQNILGVGIIEAKSISRFNNMVMDCHPILKRLKLYDINFEWDTKSILNPNNFGRLQYFRVIVYP